MARPSISAAQKVSMHVLDRVSIELTMDITLSFICLRHEQIRNMSANVILITRGIASKDFLQSVKLAPLCAVGFLHLSRLQEAAVACIQDL